MRRCGSSAVACSRTPFFDGWFAPAKYHVAAMVYASRVTPLEAILMSILVEHQKAIAQLKGRIRELEAAVLPSLTLTPPDPAA
ncbi:MAG: hypothetical protein HYS69_16935 [candidate division NC10 bacterium]|nr:hypothetical protein [candidate division NC10 bacterium]